MKKKEEKKKLTFGNYISMIFFVVIGAICGNFSASDFPRGWASCIWSYDRIQIQFFPYYELNVAKGKRKVKIPPF